MSGEDDKLDRAGDVAWEAVLSSLCRSQTVLPGAVLVGGTASALYAGHRFSFDHDHIVPDLRERFDAVLEQLEAVAGWETARVRRPVLILGSLDGVETGVRQLRRSRPLETTVLHVGDRDVALPTPAEVLRIKAFLCLDRNATRDYLDLAALASHSGMTEATAALWHMDELYPQKNGDPWAVRTQLVMQLAAPPPFDLDRVNLAEYKGVRPPFDNWDHVAAVCGALSDSLLESCITALHADPSPPARQAEVELGTWRGARAEGKVAPSANLPGLATETPAPDARRFYPCVHRGYPGARQDAGLGSADRRDPSRSAWRDRRKNPGDVRTAVVCISGISASDRGGA